MIHCLIIVFRNNSGYDSSVQVLHARPGRELDLRPELSLAHELTRIIEIRECREPKIIVSTAMS